MLPIQRKNICPACLLKRKQKANNSKQLDFGVAAADTATVREGKKDGWYCGILLFLTKKKKLLPLWEEEEAKIKEWMFLTPSRMLLFFFTSFVCRFLPDENEGKIAELVRWDSLFRTQNKWLPTFQPDTWTDVKSQRTFFPDEK